MFFTDKDMETRKGFIKTLKCELDDLIKIQAYSFKRLKQLEHQIQGLREILTALEAAEILQREIKK